MLTWELLPVSFRVNRPTELKWSLHTTWSYFRKPTGSTRNHLLSYTQVTFWDVFCGTGRASDWGRFTVLFKHNSVPWGLSSRPDLVVIS